MKSEMQKFLLVRFLYGSTLFPQDQSGYGWNILNIRFNDPVPNPSHKAIVFFFHANFLKVYYLCINLEQMHTSQNYGQPPLVMTDIKLALTQEIAK